MWLTTVDSEKIYPLTLTEELIDHRKCYIVSDTIGVRNILYFFSA